MNRILFFDGACNLCDGLVQFLVKKEPSFSFAPLQGQTAQGIVPEPLRTELSTLVYYRDGVLWTQGNALLWVLKDLGGPYKFIHVILSLVPEFLLNWIYRGIAKSRYRIFGKKEQCDFSGRYNPSYFLP